VVHQAWPHAALALTSTDPCLGGRSLEQKGRPLPAPTLRRLGQRYRWGEPYGPGDLNELDHHHRHCRSTKLASSSLWQPPPPDQSPTRSRNSISSITVMLWAVLHPRNKSLGEPQKLRHLALLEACPLAPLDKQFPKFLRAAVTKAVASSQAHVRPLQRGTLTRSSRARLEILDMKLTK
jgi:hypothetical protein